MWWTAPMHRRSTGAPGTGSPSGYTSASLRRPGRLPRAEHGPAVLTKDDAVPTNPVSLRSTLSRRAAVVAGSAAAASLFATVPAAPPGSPAGPPTSPTVTVTTPVVRLAATKPAAITLNPQAVAAAAPAAVRTSAMQKALG